jgi:hypothetical protein
LTEDVVPIIISDEGGIMGVPREPQPVKLIASVLTGQTALLARAQAMLRVAFGPIDFESGLLPFEHTDYYAGEFGSGLQRQIVAFAELVDPAELPAIKRQTNELEWELGQEGSRRVNIDPGYVSLAKLVLASTKNHGHRLYLDRGIYGEVTLTYHGGRFRPWPWTYPDYASDEYCALFARIRARYRAQLRAGSG